MHWSRTLLTLALFSEAGGCAAAGEGGGLEPYVSSPWFQDLEPDATFPGTSGTDNRSLFAFDPDTACAAPPAGLRGQLTHVRVFRGDQVSDADLAEFLGGLQRYYAQYGIAFATRYEVISIPLTHAIVVDEQALNERVLAETGLDPGAESAATPAQHELIVDALGAAILHNIREFVLAYADPRRPDLNLVLLENMTGGEPPPELAAFENYAGIGFSPELIKRLSPEDSSTERLLDWLDLPHSFTPTAIVAVEPVRRYLGEPDAAVAHEIAHAFGLPHSSEAGNLLHAADLGCVSSLSDDQLEEIEASTSSFARTLDAEALSMTSRAGELVHAIRELAQHTH